MRRLVILLVLAILVGVWWVRAAPRPEIQVAGSITINRATAEAIRAVDRSAEFAAGLEQFPSDVPPFDDMAFLQDGTTALVTATDGRIWRLNLANHSGDPLVDPPRMAYGIHDAPGDPNHLYFCASGSYSDAAPQERVGLYRFSLDTRHVEPLVIDVPATDLMNERPTVYGDNDSGAPELRPGIDVPTRALIVCDNLDVSEDGRRIYFTEPFDYTGATVDDALDEAIALAPNGRLWRYDIATRSSRGSTSTPGSSRYS